MNAFTKICRIGNGPVGNVYVKIEFTGDRLSIAGVEGPYSNGNCKGSCGQIVDHLLTDVTEYAPNWTAERAAHLVEDWNNWHLNDMQAGTPAQAAWLKANPVTYVYPESHYAKTCEALANAGLNPDNGYSYGSKWLKVAVPEDVLERLATLPETDRTPAWI